MFESEPTIAMRAAQGMGARPTTVFRGIATALFIISIPVLLVTTNIRVAANESRVYDYSIDRYDAAAVSNLPAGELKGANRELIRYFNDDEQRFLRVTVRDRGGEEVALFSPQETAHLADVKNLFQKVFFVQQAVLVYALAFVILIFLWARELPLRALATALLRASGLTIGLVTAAALAALAGFDEIWLRFHFLAFANDLWRLDPAQDHLIQMFPRDFWYDISLIIGAFTAVEALIIAGLSSLYLYATRPIVKDYVRPRPVLPERPRPRHLPR
ncbi:MAG: TIGR01906 family membrane protein [Dehalococcoidia bacterium]